MLIQKTYINKLLNDSVQFSHWIDHLTLNLKTRIGKLHYILSVLDLDNSNQYYEDLNWYKLNYSKAISKNGLYLMVTISIKGIPHTIFNYLEYPDNKKDMFKSEWSFTFYSTYFRLCERWDLDLSFEKVFFWNFYRIFIACGKGNAVKACGKFIFKVNCLIVFCRFNQGYMEVAEFFWYNRRVLKLKNEYADDKNGVKSQQNQWFS